MTRQYLSKSQYFDRIELQNLCNAKQHTVRYLFREKMIIPQRQGRYKNYTFKELVYIGICKHLVDMKGYFTPDIELLLHPCEDYGQKLVTESLGKIILFSSGDIEKFHFCNVIDPILQKNLHDKVMHLSWHKLNNENVKTINFNLKKLRMNLYETVEQSKLEKDRKKQRLKIIKV